MFEQLIGKLVIIEFERTGNSNQRTIARLIDVKDGFLELQSPTSKNNYAVNMKTVIEINELPPRSIKPGLV